MFLDANLLLALSSALIYCTKSDTRVVTTHGEIQGITEKTPVTLFGPTVDVDVFWGIPYAKPPKGDLRFKPPVEAEKWSGVLKTNKLPNACFQVPDNDSLLVDFSAQPYAVSEDCLYLNIWRPNCQDPTGNMATMVWIHGGSFMSGSSAANVYNGAKLAAMNCVIVASMNYRLGAFGFLYLGTADSPGNMGLLDVAMALTWIKNNVDRFEGNPDSITIFGQDAGAAIVSLFLLSPLTRDLFNNAIMQSGTAFVKPYHQSKTSALKAAQDLSNSLKCYSSDSTAIVQCLKKITPTNLANMHSTLAKGFMHFMLPVTDGDFLPEDPMDILMTGDVKRCNIMVGNTKDEGTYILKKVLPQQVDFNYRYAPDFDDQGLNQAITRLFSLSYKDHYIQFMINHMKLLYNYNNLKHLIRNPGITLLNYIIRDSKFMCPRNVIANAYAKLSHDVYAYSFHYAGQGSRLPDWAGATHGIEVPLLFGTKTSTFPSFTLIDDGVSEIMMKMWSNFAKFGNPTPYGSVYVIWPQYTLRDPAIAIFTEEGSRKNWRIDGKVCDDWRTIPSEFFKD